MRHLPGIPIEIENMHKAGDSVCQNLPRDAVSIEAVAAMRGSVAVR
jgi:hypothetical protein